VTAAILRAAAAVPGRARRGRPARITARAVIAAATAPADITAAALWLALAGRAELAPPPPPGRR
jgi:hypothetical protein